MGGSERRREIRRRRKRKKKVLHWRERAAKASASEKAVIADKLRSLTPGADTLIASMELEKR